MISRGLSFVFIVLLSLCYRSVRSQTWIVNELGKLEMAEVVLSDGFTKEALYKNSLRWIKSLPGPDKIINALSVDSVLCKVSGRYEFLVYVQGGMLKKKAGAISCIITLEMKDNKYRYVFTDFLFYYFVQDRNYQMVKSGKTKPLEDQEAPGWQRQWNNHKLATANEMKKRITELKGIMIERLNLAKEKPGPEIEW